MVWNGLLENREKRNKRILIVQEKTRECEKQVTFWNKTPKVHQQINVAPIIYAATDFSAQLVAVKTFLMSGMHYLKREINKLRENVNKSDQSAGENSLYQE